MFRNVPVNRRSALFGITCVVFFPSGHGSDLVAFSSCAEAVSYCHYGSRRPTRGGLLTSLKCGIGSIPDNRIIRAALEPSGLLVARGGS